MPFRAIPQDNSYAFLRGINTSDIFWQRSTAAKGTGLFLEPNGDACTDNTVAPKAAQTNPANAE